MGYTCTTFGVDISSRFPARAWTNRQTNATERLTHASSYTGVGNNQRPKWFGKRPHRRLVIPCGSKCEQCAIHPCVAMGQHIPPQNCPVPWGSGVDPVWWASTSPLKTAPFREDLDWTPSDGPAHPPSKLPLSVRIWSEPHLMGQHIPPQNCPFPWGSGLDPSNGPAHPPQNCPFPWGSGVNPVWWASTSPLKTAPFREDLEWTPTNAWFLGPTWANKRTHNQFSRYCTAHAYDRQTDRHADHTMCTICSNRPHLCTSCHPACNAA